MFLIRRTFFFFLVFILLLFLAFSHINTSISIENFPGDPYEPVISTETLAINNDSTSIESAILGAVPVPGFTLFNRLYLRNGTLYVVSSNVTSLPPRRNVLSIPVDVGHGRNLDPTDKELQYIDPHQAEGKLGDRATLIEGLTMILYDTNQFMDHFYHWWGEIILGSWRVYSAFVHSTNGSWPPPFPARFILPHIHQNEWHDRAGMNAPLMRACFPSASIEREDYWQDLIDLDQTVVFERAMIVSREASRKHPFSGKWFKMMAGTMSVPTFDGFWEHIRTTTITNVLGYLPTAVVDPDPKSGEKPIVTYISRQGAGRRLNEIDHDVLVKSLRQLEKDGICEVVVAIMERMSLQEQIYLASRSTILVGVHGNGLTHEIWMPSSPRSTIIEIFIPKGYVFDYELPARILGHRHYAVWNDTLITYPKGTYYKGITYGDGFHGNSIPVYGPAVARVIRERLTESIVS